MFRCRTTHRESPFSLGLWLGSVFDGLDATPPCADLCRSAMTFTNVRDFHIRA
jgi:hypothetical protein